MPFIYIKMFKTLFFARKAMSAYCLQFQYVQEIPTDLLHFLSFLVVE